jgi:hypothetical protein
MSDRQLWRGRLEQGGFRIIEQGKAPAVIYFVARLPE